MDPLEEPDVLDQAGRLLLQVNELREVVSIHRLALEELMRMHLQSRDVHLDDSQVVRLVDRFLSVPRGTPLFDVLDVEGIV